MAASKRIMISLPLTLLEEVDTVLCIEKMNRSELIREAMNFYLREKRRIRLREEMRRGYLEMARLNLVISQECFDCEEEVSVFIERKFMECS